MPPAVLLVEDDPEIAEIVRVNLASAGLSVRRAGDALEAERLLGAGHFDLVVLDLSLPGAQDGLDLCRTIRTRHSYLPILMLTARASEVDRVVGLELGADDYVAKPFSVRELVARVRAVIRRVELVRSSSSAPGPMLRLGALEIDLERRQVRLGERCFELTPKEFELLAVFARHPERVFTRAQLLDLVWGYSHAGYEHTVNSHINRLRAKVEADPERPALIRTVWGVGYKLTAPGTGR